MRYYQVNQQQALPLAVGKAVCVGRNYADHIAELNNPVPTEPLLFMKPSTAIVPIEGQVKIPASGDCHNELEIALLMEKTVTRGNTWSDDRVHNCIWGVGLALDLTMRTVQTQLKRQGHPWELAKAFDNSCPVSHFVARREITDLQQLEFGLTVNGQTRQLGQSSMMLFDCIALIKHISQHFTLLPGDLVLTGTPKGVAPLRLGDDLAVSLSDAAVPNKVLLAASTQVIVA